MTDLIRYQSQAPALTLSEWPAVLPDEATRSDFAALLVKQSNVPARKAEDWPALIAAYGWTEAEFCYAMVRFRASDEKHESVTYKSQNADWPIRALRRIIDEARRVRSYLTRELTSWDLRQVLDLCPELRPEMFGVCGYEPGERDDKPLYRFVGSAGPRRPDYAALHEAEMEDTRRRAAQFHGWT